jgi:hypothetical protein
LFLFAPCSRGPRTHQGGHLAGKRQNAVPLESLVLVEFEERAHDLEAMHSALHKLSGFDPELSQAIELRFFAGASAKEAAQILNLSLRTLERRWEATRAWLFEEWAPFLDREAPDAPEIRAEVQRLLASSPPTNFAKPPEEDQAVESLRPRSFRSLIRSHPEWEYAARMGLNGGLFPLNAAGERVSTNTQTPVNADDSDDALLAKFFSAAVPERDPAYPADRQGLRHMFGNFYEWTESLDFESNPMTNIYSYTEEGITLTSAQYWVLFDWTNEGPARIFSLNALQLRWQEYVLSPH